eukprot:m.92008 g.92008  ORF g.92008 m.92008 type:complete len:163 (-) comp14925_c0_seq8:1330-1818(-)
MGRTNVGRSKPAASANGKVVHPNSRRAKKMSRGALRKDKLFDQAKVTNIAQYNEAVKLRWFQEQLEEGKKCYEHHEVVAMVERYLQFKQSEVEQLKASKVAATSHRAITMETHFETAVAQFTSQHGLQAPDLTQKRVVERLRGWDGELKFVRAIESANFRKK